MSNQTFNFQSIQDNIDTIYKTKWFQPNACYPVTLCYTSDKVSNEKFSISDFLELHTNNSTAPGGKEEYIRKSDDSVKDLAAYMKKEVDATKDCVRANDKVLAYFSKVSGLNPPELNLSRVGGALVAGNQDANGSTITLEFLHDRQFEVLHFLQAWQSRWFVHEYQKKAFTDKSVDYGIDTTRNKGGGEGFLGLANCAIDFNGTVSVLSHLSLFGLIPKKIELVQEVGPQTNTSDITKIKVHCIYSNAIWVYPVDTGTTKRLNYYYYK